MKQTFLLIDGNSLINRAFFAVPPLNSPDGTPTNAVYGFINMLLKAIGDYNPSHICIAFDLKAKTFRHHIYAEYKATRKSMADELAIQLPILKDILIKMNIKIANIEGYEADDIIGTLSKQGDDVIIITGDKDAFQLIDKRVKVAYTKKGLSLIEIYDEEKFFSEYGFEPNKLIDYKALLGDASDNIPGVEGIGDKGARTLLIEYGDLKGVYEGLDNMKEGLRLKLGKGKDSAFLSYVLATIDTKVPIEFSAEDCIFSMPFGADVKYEFKKLGLNSLLKREELFCSDENNIQAKKEEILINDIESLNNLVDNFNESIINFDIKNDIYFKILDRDYVVKLKEDLLSIGLDYNTALKALAPVLQNKDILKVVYDAKSLIKKLAQNSIFINNYFDTKLACYLLGYSLENNKDYQSLIDDLKQKNMHKLYYDLELPLVQVLISMEEHGFKLDTKLLYTLGQEFDGRLKGISQDIYKLADKEFNINSPKQLASVLFEDLNIPYPKKSKTYSTAVDILEPLAKNYPIAQKILDYRSLFKLNSTYIEGLKKLADINGVIRTEFKQMVTTTGRLSSVEPNLQNIPIREQEGKRLRELFIAKDGYKLIAADYSQIELRLLAHFSKDPVLCEAFFNDEDIHIQTAKKVFGVSNPTKEQRSEAKAVNFGIIYGISDFGLASQLNIGHFKARNLIDSYFMQFEKVKEYLDGSVLNAKNSGYSETILGRRREILELKSSNMAVKKFGERAAMNMPLQGSAADIIKAAMLVVYKRLADEFGDSDARLILQVHDELIVEAKDDIVDKVKIILKESMENAIKLEVPLKVDIASGASWLDCK
ncbi:MAG: DNA polymerase I [Firmicutes bacterium]|nr:DNA polymerase I [Bacillota bacterium]